MKNGEMMKCAMMAFATLAVAAAGAGDLRLVAGGAALLEFGRVAVPDGLWKLTVSRPEKDRIEDFHIDATGVTGTLFLSPDRYWREH